MKNPLNDKPGGDETGAKILERLQTALRSDGDFPVRAKVVSELRARALNPNSSVNQVADLILREPALGTRILHIVNSAFYQRAKPVVTVSQAVMRLGMSSICDLCAGLVLMQKFVPAAKRGGIFADCVKRNIVTALISNEIARRSKDSEVAEKGYLAGTFYHLGHLLLAYYFPQVYEAAGRRAETRGYDVSRSLSEVLGRSPVELVLSIVESLSIPSFYCDVLMAAADIKPKGRKLGAEDQTLLELAQALRIAGTLSEAIIDGKSRKQVVEAVAQFSQLPGIGEEFLVETLRRLPDAFNQHCAFIDLSFLTLPDFLQNFEMGVPEESPPEPAPAAEEDDPITEELEEILEAVESGEPVSSIVALVMELLAGPMEFDRVLLLEVDAARMGLVGRLSIGEAFPKEPAHIHRPFNATDKNAPDVAALLSGSPVIYGSPIFAGGWPFAAVPIGNGKKSRGVIYADKLEPDEGEKGGADPDPLDSSVHAMLSILAEVLDEAVKKADDW